MTTPLGKLSALRLKSVVFSGNLLQFSTNDSPPAANALTYVNCGPDLTGQLSPFRGGCLSEIMTGATTLYVVSPFANANNTLPASATPTISAAEIVLMNAYFRARYGSPFGA